MDDFLGSLFSYSDPADNGKSFVESAFKKKTEETTEIENVKEGEKEADTNDLREENHMLRIHMEELNKHVIRLSNSDKLQVLQRDLEHANELRSSAETYVASKNAELKHLNHLINEQITKTKASEEELKQVRKQLTEANLKMLPTVKLRSELFESKEQIKQLRQINDELQAKLENSLRECSVKDKLILNQKQNLDDLTTSYQKLNVLNMELESLKTSQNLDLMDSKSKVDKLFEEKSLLSVRNEELTMEKSRLHRIILHQAMTTKSNFPDGFKMRKRIERPGDDCEDGSRDNCHITTDEESSIDICAPMARVVTTQVKKQSQTSRAKKSVNEETDSLLSAFKQQTLDLAQSSSELIHNIDTTDCMCVGTEIFSAVFRS